MHPNQCKFSDVDWIIGNHSDELTPWIPVIAARYSPLHDFCLSKNNFVDEGDYHWLLIKKPWEGLSDLEKKFFSFLVSVNLPFSYFRSSYKTKYFLLPCCFHDFDGKVKNLSLNLCRGDYLFL